MVKILKSTKLYKGSSEKNHYIRFDLEGNQQLLPIAEFKAKIDEYEQYIKEKDNCNHYNLIFTINMVASNVLCNNLSEIMINEGSDDCIVFNTTGPSNKKTLSAVTGLVDYCKNYKSIDPSGLTNEYFIRDTSFSNEKLGKVVYHCGYDIFSNHNLRKKEFSIINVLKGEADKDYCRENFNTLSDYKRDYYGNIIEDNTNTLQHIKDNDDNYTILTTNSGKTKSHRYGLDNLYTIRESIKNNLVEDNGWFGFINKANLNIHNCVFKVDDNDEKRNYDLSIDRIMNNNKPCEQIDLYPDRSLFYLKPKFNSFRNRVEHNWLYCITYPYENLYNNDVVGETVNSGSIKHYMNGPKCYLMSTVYDLFTFESGKTETNDSTEDYIKIKDKNYHPIYKSNSVLYFKTDVRHNIEDGDIIHILIFHEDDNGDCVSFYETGDIQVNSVGYSNEYTENIFSIMSNDFDGLKFSDYLSGNTDNPISAFTFANNVHFRFKKIVNGYPCEYYIRKFKRLPNFKNTNYYNDYLKDEEIINKYVLKDFNSSLNNLAFSTNIYGDPIGQILFNDDIVTSGIFDNLGRPLTELYLTIIKNNKGYKEWYYKNNYSGETVEYSHCFGKLTSGFDFLPYTDDYNIHKIHNIDIDNLNKDSFRTMFTGSEYSESAVTNTINKFFNIGKSAKSNENDIEGEITISGDTFFGDENGIFFGDIAEFSPSESEESIIEKVYFRFNTVQREYTEDARYYNFNYEELSSDDYKLFDLKETGNVSYGGFSSIMQSYNAIVGDSSTKEKEGDKLKFYKNYPVNLNPEGYYYNPHYQIKLKEFSSTLKNGYHTLLTFTVASEDTSGNSFTVTTAKNYYLQSGDTLILYNIEVSKLKKDGKNRFYSNHLVNSDYEPLYGTVTDVSGILGTQVTFTVDIENEIDITNYRVFKYNKEKNAYAQELYDGDGSFVWKEIKSEKNYRQDDELYNTVFTNGRKYLHNNINVFLRRQDQYGDYGLNLKSVESIPSSAYALMPESNSKDVSLSEDVNNETASLCGYDISGELEKAETLLADEGKAIADVFMKNVNNMKAINDEAQEISKFINKFIDNGQD